LAERETERDTIAEEVGEFLERLGRRISHAEHHAGREQRHNERLERRGEHMAERAERMAERFAGHFGFNFGGAGDDDGMVDAATDGPVVERDLLFGEQPELRLTAGPMSVRICQVEPGGKARLELRGREAHEAEVEIGKWDDAVAVEVRPSRGFRGFRNFSGLTLFLFLPEGVRVRGRVDAGTITVEGLKGADLDLRADAGKLQLENCEGRLRVVSSAGKIVLDHCSGSLEARTDAGKVVIESFTGSVQARAEAGTINCRLLRLSEGAHQLETKLGSVDVTLVPDVPVRIDTHASLGSVNNKIGAGQPDAPASLSLRTEMGSIRIRYEEAPPSPLRSVPVMDERGTPPAAGGYKPVDLHRVPFSDEPDTAPAQAAAGPQASAATQPEASAEPHAQAPDRQSETVRILGMVERHEISAGEAATLLSALRG
jgi:hypothetical protein